METFGYIALGFVVGILLLLDMIIYTLSQGKYGVLRRFYDFLMD